MIGIAAVYVFAGVEFAVMALLSAGDRSNAKRWANAFFWGLFALSFLAGDYLGDFANGLLVLIMVLIAGTIGLGIGRTATTTPQQREVSARVYRNKLFIPA